tara:strand:+ start:4849 stop:5259 length:411 start_codon:yes stop_codon:yes gene_type:complete
MADSRSKGASFERAICTKINDFLVGMNSPIRVKRNLDQYQMAGMCDVELPNHAIECKAYKSGWWFAPAWWQQVVESCGDKTPILIYKFNNKGIRVCAPLYFVNPSLPRDNDRTVVMTLDEWFNILSTTEEFLANAA